MISTWERPMAPSWGPSWGPSWAGPTVVPAWDVPERALEAGGCDPCEAYEASYIDAMEDAVLMDEGCWGNDLVEYAYDVAGVESLLDDVGLRRLAEVELRAVRPLHRPAPAPPRAARRAETPAESEVAMLDCEGVDTQLSSAMTSSMLLTFWTTGWASLFRRASAGRANGNSGTRTSLRTGRR